jgi:hypothetical protein
MDTQTQIIPPGKSSIGRAPDQATESPKVNKTNAAVTPGLAKEMIGELVKATKNGDQTGSVKSASNIMRGLSGVFPSPAELTEMGVLPNKPK